MTDVIERGVKELIEALRKLHTKDGKPATWTDLEERYGVSRQTLSNWANGSKEHDQLFEFIENARQALGYKENFTYRLTVKRKRDKTIQTLKS